MIRRVSGLVLVLLLLPAVLAAADADPSFANIPSQPVDEQLLGFNVSVHNNGTVNLSHDIVLSYPAGAFVYNASSPAANSSNSSALVFENVSLAVNETFSASVTLEANTTGSRNLTLTVKNASVLAQDSAQLFVYPSGNAPAVGVYAAPGHADEDTTVFVEVRSQGLADLSDATLSLFANQSLSLVRSSRPLNASTASQYNWTLNLSSQQAASYQLVFSAPSGDVRYTARITDGNESASASLDVPYAASVNASTYNFTALLNQELGLVTGTLSGVYDVLRSSRVQNAGQAVTAQQSLTLANTSGRVVFAENHVDVIDDFLFYNENLPVFNYSLAFSPALSSSVTDGRAPGIEAVTLELLGEQFHVYQAVTDSVSSLTLSLVSAPVIDSLAAGQTRTYTANGSTFTVSLAAVDVEQDRYNLTVDGPGGATSTVTSAQPLVTNSAGPVPVSFAFVAMNASVNSSQVLVFVGSRTAVLADTNVSSEGSGSWTVESEAIEDASADLVGSVNATHVTLTNVSYGVVLDSSYKSDSYVSAGGNVSSLLDEPQGFLSRAWDVVFADLVQPLNDSFAWNVSDGQYSFFFTSAAGTSYDVAFAYRNASDSYVLGNQSNSLVLFERDADGDSSANNASDYVISLNDTFVVTAANSSAALTFSSVDNSSQQVSFSDAGVARTYNYSGTPTTDPAAPATGNLSLFGTDFGFWLFAPSPGDYRLAVDLDASGNLSDESLVPLVTRNGARINLTNQSVLGANWTAALVTPAAARTSGADLVTRINFTTQNNQTSMSFSSSETLWQQDAAADDSRTYLRTLHGAALTRVSADNASDNLSVSYLFAEQQARLSLTTKALAGERTDARITSANAVSVGTDSASLSVATSSQMSCRYGLSNASWQQLSAFGSSGALSHSTALSGISADTDYTYYVRCRASEGFDTAAVSFTTDQEEESSDDSGSSGGGGGGGGAAYGPGADSDREARLDVSFAASGTREEFSIAKADVSVEHVSFTLASQTTSGSVTVTRKDDSPVPFSRDIYEVLEFTPGSLQVRDVEIGFRVQKSWIDARGAAADVRLYRLVEGEWVQLSTRITETDGSTYRFRASSPGFSFFLIGMRDPLPPQDSSPNNASRNASEGVAGNASASGGESQLSTRPEQESAPASSPWPLLLWVFAAVLVGIAAVFGVRRYRQPDESDESDKSPQESAQDGLSARERFEHAVERAMVAVQKDDYATAHDEYLAAHEAYSQAADEPEQWLADANERLTKVYDSIQRASSEQ